jgi:hypothetical protein
VVGRCPETIKTKTKIKIKIKTKRTIKTKIKIKIKTRRTIQLVDWCPTGFKMGLNY